MILSLVLLASVQAAVPDRYPPDADCQEYKDGSTIAISECLKAQAAKWEERLATEYSAAIERAEVNVETLETAQRAWLKYRDINCEAYDTVEGSIHTILAGRCWRDMTRDRTLELREMKWTG
ncbi:MAG: lysozyme inhibitor LprI family protein [Novosphingobium sp.]